MGGVGDVDCEHRWRVTTVVVGSRAWVENQCRLCGATAVDTEAVLNPGLRPPGP